MPEFSIVDTDSYLQNKIKENLRYSRVGHQSSQSNRVHQLVPNWSCLNNITRDTTRNSEKHDQEKKKKDLTTFSEEKRKVQSVRRS